MYDKNNIFAKILRGEIPCTKVYEDEFALAFNDIAPTAPIHILVIPKGEYVSYDDFMGRGKPHEISGYFKAIRTITHNLGIEKTGYSLISNTGKDGGQIVFHFHTHIIAGKHLGGLVGKG